MHEEFPIDSGSKKSTSLDIDDDDVDDEPRSKIKVQQSMLSFVKRPSLPEVIAKLLAVDGFPAYAVCNSEFIRQSLSERGLLLPKDTSSVMNLMHKFFEEAKQKTISEIKLLKVGKFSVTLDEWSSLKNRRYLNVNIHAPNGKFFNLGLKKINGSCPAEKVEQLLVEKLYEFDLRLCDVVGDYRRGECDGEVWSENTKFTSAMLQSCCSSSCIGCSNEKRQRPGVG